MPVRRLAQALYAGFVLASAAAFSSTPSPVVSNTRRRRRSAITWHKWTQFAAFDSRTETCQQQQQQQSTSCSTTTLQVEEEYDYGSAESLTQTLVEENVVLQRLKQIPAAVQSKFDVSKVSSLGVPFVLSYSLISNLNGAGTLSVAWYMSSRRTGLSPLLPGQWKSLLAAYGTIYAAIQLLRPIRVGAAIAMSRFSSRFLKQCQGKLNCSRGVAIFVHYSLGWVLWFALAFVGVSCASVLTGVPILAETS